jgi:hypothetical protein
VSVKEQGNILKHFAIAGLIAIVFYVVGYSWLEHKRVDKGPWQITFRTDGAGTPEILIAQSNLNIFQTVSFPSARTNANISKSIIFGQDPPELPFGQLIYQDPTFLPGTVTMKMFGHDVELLPRILTIDKKQYSWPSGDIIVP